MTKGRYVSPFSRHRLAADRELCLVYELSASGSEAKALDATAALSTFLTAFHGLKRR